MCKLWYNILSLRPSFSSWLCWTDTLSSYLQSNYGLEAALQVFAHCPPAWPSYDLNSSFSLRSRKHGWYPAPLYSLTYLLARQTRAPSDVRCKGDGCELGTKHWLLKNRHWGVAELHLRWNQGWTHLCHWDKSQTNFVLLKIPPSFIKSYAKFTNSFQNKLRSLGQK